MIIDEIQRLPELLLSIKARVDERPLSFGPKLRAMPISALWELEP